MLPDACPDEPQFVAVRAPVPVAITRTSGARRRRLLIEDGKSLSDHGHSLTARQIDFGRALDAYKRKYRKPFPTFGEVLDVIDALGYRLVAEPVEA
jgi:hypothetical protein